jgi:8-oxo-dGTP pyrophosphatase MutT (NUDIX family)
MADWVPREEWVASQPRALLASCVVMLDARGRVLMLRYGPGQPSAGNWWLPGGMLDHGEDPRTAVRREMWEETGLELAPTPRLIGIDHRADVLGTGPVLDCFFDGGDLAQDAEIRLSAEHDRYAMFDLDELTRLPLSAGHVTLSALHAAVVTGTFVYLREGSPL